MKLKEAKKFFKDRGYDPEELKQYTDLELIVLAQDQKKREEEKYD